MKYLLTCLLVLFTPFAAYAADPSGHWEGAIELPNGELPILVTLTSEGDQAWAGTIDIPAQGLHGFDLAQVTVDGDQIHFEMAGVPGVPTFEGTLSDDGDAITGPFKQGPQVLSFSLRRSTEAPEAAAQAPPAAEPVPGDGAVGEWLGTLDVGAVDLRLALHIETDIEADTEAGTEGTLSAVLDSIDQDVKIAVDTITFEQRTMKLTLASIAASFEGVMNEDGSAVEGTWSQSGRKFPLTFRRTAEAFSLARPQMPRAPFPYDSREVSFSNEAAGIELAGTLITPHGDGPFPAVVFITGSGAQDRDESLMGHKPFWVISDYLARRGIASLRYDDRGTAKSAGDHMGSTVSDFADDANAAVAFLAAQAKIDSQAIGIVGHSEGGLSGPKVATMNDQIDFLVLLAPPGEPLDALLERQSRDLLRVAGIDPDLIDRAFAGQAGDIALIKDESLTSAELADKLRARAAAQAKAFTEAELAILGINPAAVEQGIGVSTTPWFRSLMREDPAVYLRKIKIPVLALFGDKDLQVDAQVNGAALRAALEAAANEDHEIHVFAGLNHLFQHAETGAIAEYGTIEETIAPETLAMIGDWIARRFIDG